MQWTSLVDLWKGVCQPLQGTQVQSLLREDFTCCGMTKASVPQLLSPCPVAHSCNY